jgi:uncharacterized protein YyaL (SSP411 family)
MTSPEGGFYSAEDADSVVDPAHPHEKAEGAFYVWSAAELAEILGPDEAAIFGRRYGIRANGNVDEDPHGEFRGKNILFQAQDADPADLPSLARSAAKLLGARATRPRPHLDDKVLAGWNGMMISAFAKAAQILDEPRYADAARRAAAFVHEKLWREDNTLLRRYRDGESAIEAFLDDYAGMIGALIDLYETDFNPAHLAWADALATTAIARFEDPEGGFFSTQAGQSDLVLRLKDDYDGAEPSGNSVMIGALLKLARLRDHDEFRQAADRALHAFLGKLRTAGPGLPQMLCAAMFAAGKPMEIVIAGEPDAAMLRVLRSRFLPNAIVLRASDSPDASIYADPGVYVCENFACKLPAKTGEELENRLQ